MKKDIKAYVGGCETCQQTKSSNKAKSAPLYPNTIPTEPWTHISIDMITGLPESNGHDALLVIVDRFSKAIILVPCNVELSTEGWAQILCDHFASEFMKELYWMLNIKQNTSTTFHPQTDGQTDDWADWLLLAEFAHNNRTHSATGKSPFMTLYGRNPQIMPDSPCPANSKVPAASDFSKVMAKIHKETKEALEEAAGQMKVQYDKHKHPSQEYHARDLVWLDTTNLHLPRPKKKLNDKCIGPFKILEKTGMSAYKLKLLPHWKIHPHFNEKLLTPYIPPTFPNQEQPPPPPPDLIDNEEQWELEEVLDSKTHKVRGKRGQPSMTIINYFVKWKGWTREHNSWVMEKEMGNAREAIAKYIKKTKRNERVAVVQIATTPRSPLTMIVNHHYSDDGDFSYLAQ
ncbi:uncharacterized protein ARMOST_21782 [Armillaria ostoyae]|uniref:Chromo domain-containing protein n=1 Tax=Armillaria ostoyae TaxID=47428 RepID=A0A284SB03_ARMOS|nr:uncharacterized protein ARMOST_21782 [Armillaria ostoyae]